MSASVVTRRLRVASVRSRLQWGVIFSGYPIEADGGQDNREPFVVKAVGEAYSGIERGELWEVTGELGQQIIHVNGVPWTERLITAQDLRLLKPSGNQIVLWIAEHKLIRGIGHVKAQRLWDALGEDLYSALDVGEPGRLLEVIGNADSVRRVLEAWAEDGDAPTLPVDATASDTDRTGAQGDPPSRSRYLGRAERGSLPVALILRLLGLRGRSRPQAVGDRRRRSTAPTGGGRVGAIRSVGRWPYLRAA